MGVEGLKLFILSVRDECAIQSATPLYKCVGLRNKTIAIDASIFIYQLYEDSKLENLKKNLTIMIKDFKQNKIDMIWVFDGKSNSLKDKTIEKRKLEKNDAILEYEKCMNSGDIKKANQLKLSIIKLVPEAIILVRSILKLYSIKIIDAEEEADVVCASLVNTDKAWACLSEDTDLFVYGCKRVIRSYTVKKKNVMIYNFDAILQKLDIPFSDFRMICAVSGTDYNVEKAIPLKVVINYYNDFRKEKEKNVDSANFIDWLYDKSIIDNREKLYSVLDYMDISNAKYTYNR